MLFALLILMTVIQTQSLPQEAVQPVPAPTASAVSPASSASAVAASDAAATVEAASPEPEPEPEAEPELPTRQVCRYVEVTGQRFPVRTCRTVTIYPDDSH